MLFAVLTSSVLLSIGLSIFNLTVKEIALSGSGRDSQAAFYAADGGVECALYWDVIATDVFATSTGSYNPLGIVPTCGDQAISLVPIARNSNSATTEFSFAPTDADPGDRTGGVCSLVQVTKNSSSGSMVTTIVSRGYNVGYQDDGTGATNKCLASDSLKVERALLITY